MSDYKNIYLVGMPGAGKSTMGKQLALALGRNFIDLDDLIEEQMEMKVSGIFSELGESSFRTAEQRALHSTLMETNHVIGTGGGTACFFDNMEWMNKHGVTVFLDPPLETLEARIRQDFKERPKLDGADSLMLVLKRTYTEREKFYMKAQHRIADPDISADMLISVLKSETE